MPPTRPPAAHASAADVGWIEPFGDRFADSIVIWLELLRLRRSRACAPGGRRAARAARRRGSPSRRAAAAATAAVIGCALSAIAVSSRCAPTAARRHARGSPCRARTGPPTVNAWCTSSWTKNELPRDSRAISAQRSGGMSGRGRQLAAGEIVRLVGRELVDVQRADVATSCVVEQPLAQRTHQRRVTVFRTVRQRGAARAEGPAAATSPAGAKRCRDRPTAGRRWPARAACDPRCARAARGAPSRPGAAAPAHRAERSTRALRRSTSATRNSTGNRRAMSDASRGSGARPRWPAAAGGTAPGRRRVHPRPCTAPTRARGIARADTTGASGRCRRSARNRRISADLPTPDGPGMNTTTERPAARGLERRRQARGDARRGRSVTRGRGVVSRRRLRRRTARVAFRRRRISSAFGRFDGSGSSSATLSVMQIGRSRSAPAIEGACAWRAACRACAGKRQPAGQRLVQHHADAVPIGRR